MAQRNMLCAHQTLDLEIEPGQTHLYPELHFLLGNTIDLTNSIHPVLSASGNATNLDLHHFSDHHDTNIFYGNQYDNLQHSQHSVPNLDVGNLYMIPSSASRIFPMPPNYGSSDHMPSSSNHGVIGAGVDEYDRNNHFMDSLRGSCKRKTAEVVPGSSQYVNGSTSSSSTSSGAPLNSGTQQWEEPFGPGVGVLDTMNYTSSEYRGSGTLSITEGSQRSVRSRSNAINLQLDSALAYHNHLLQANYMGRSIQLASEAWMEQFRSSGGDISSSNLNCAHPMPYLHGRNVSGGLLEIGPINGQGYQDTVSSRNSAILLHPSSMHQHHNHHLPPPMQGMQGPNYGFHPHLPAPSYRHLTNNNLHHSTINSSRDSLESASRYPRPFPSSGDRIYRPHRRVPQFAPEEINGRMWLLSEDATILEFPAFYGVRNFIDQHRDMRLDIDDMSYEELLALEERIGDVNTGLSEETISKCLRTRVRGSCTASSPMDPPSEIIQENRTCIICQVEYEENEKIGILECGHDYHVDCIKQWLLLKNACPICKTPALSRDKKE